MSQNFHNESYWYLMTIDDAPNSLPGKSFYEIFKIFLLVENIKFVILDRMQVAGEFDLISTLHEEKDHVFELTTILEKICDIIQVDWGDFYLFKEYPYNWNNPNGEGYPYVVAQSHITLRAVDDQYMYIYTQNKKIVDIVKSNYLVELIKHDLLENLDYPE